MADIVVRTSAKRTREIFAADFASPSSLEQPSNPIFSIPAPSAGPTDVAHQINIASRIRNEYEDVRELPAALAAKMATSASTAVERRKKIKAQNAQEQATDPKMRMMIEGASQKADQARAQSQALTIRAGGKGAAPNADGPTPVRNVPSTAMVRKDTVRQVRPDWYAPWKVMRVISGHMGWCRSLAVDSDNKWFASGAADRTIKIWDLASGQLRLTLTGHISAVRGLAVSSSGPYLYSCGEDKKVIQWDLEVNRQVRSFHGHLSGVYTLALHPTLDILVTGGRDGAVRVWDARTRSQVHTMTGHKGTISSLLTNAVDPQVISGSMDSTIRFWDLRKGTTMGVLTHHKKSVRALAAHPMEHTFVSGSAQSMKQWLLPKGDLMVNYEGVNSILNTVAVNEDNVLFGGGDDGSIGFWDYKTGHKFQNGQSIAQPGSLDAEAGVMCSTFDRSGLRLITGESDKSIKIWKRDEDATEETHPLEWQPTLGRRKY